MQATAIDIARYLRDVAEALEANPEDFYTAAETVQIQADRLWELVGEDDETEEEEE